jgi:isochorismate synthase EntC
MDHIDWFDEHFFQNGCFIKIGSEKKIIFAKNGIWKKELPPSKIKLQIRDFYDQEIKYYHSNEIILIPFEFIKTFIKPITKNFSVSQEKNYKEIFDNDFDLFANSKNEVDKVVLMSRKEYQVQNVEELKKYCIIKSLLTSQGESYGFWNDDFTMVGITPEILFESEGLNITSYAIAGTSLLKEKNNLETSTKDLKEHQIVITNILEDLKPFCRDLEALETMIIPFGKLAHLKTCIKGKLNNHISPNDIIFALSPTAALGGYPRKNAHDFLLNTHYYQYFPKRYHGSVFSADYENKFLSLVMIRNIQIQNQTLILEAGAGVVDSSKKSSEFKEIYQKIESIKEMLL